MDLKTEGQSGETSNYPLFQEILSIKGLPLQPIYTTKEVALIFDVTPRTIQQWIESRKMIARDLPGRGRFLPVDLEESIRKSKKDGDGKTG